MIGPPYDIYEVLGANRAHPTSPRVSLEESVALYLKVWALAPHGSYILVDNLIF